MLHPRVSRMPSWAEESAAPAYLMSNARLVDAGKMRPYVGRVYPLNQVAQAWRDSRQNQIEGKIVLTVGD
jgi:NADPH:quinone reductase-like Zn-dependent oxidoreductase